MNGPTVGGAATEDDARAASPGRAVFSGTFASRGSVFGRTRAGDQPERGPQAEAPETSWLTWRAASRSAVRVTCTAGRRTAAERTTAYTCRSGAESGSPR